MRNAILLGLFAAWGCGESGSDDLDAGAPDGSYFE